MHDLNAIVSARLLLIPLQLESLRAMLRGDREEAQASCGFGVSSDCTLMKDTWIAHWIEMIERDPEQQRWLRRAMVRQSDKVMVGDIGFHHKAPDPDLLEYSTNAAELGYTVYAPFRRNGYARESALALMEWANAQGVGVFCLTISPENGPSLGLAESMGFKKVSERMDDVDGLEHVFLFDWTEGRR